MTNQEGNIMQPFLLFSSCTHSFVKNDVEQQNLNMRFRDDDFKARMTRELSIEIDSKQNSTSD